MRSEPDSPEHRRRRSQFIKGLVQVSRALQPLGNEAPSIPYTVVQFWREPAQVPGDVLECISSWSKWETFDFTHRPFDKVSAGDFVRRSLGRDHARAFKRCYHSAMHADYFRLCYLLVEGGLYVDADDACMANNISSLCEGFQLKIQPRCYDIESDSMVRPAGFLHPSANDEGWIFYFNNNPLIASQGEPAIKRVLERATKLLNSAMDGGLPESRSTTGSGNLSRAIFELGEAYAIDNRVLILRDWQPIAVSRWPLNYRCDARNWRPSNGKRFHVAMQDTQ